MVSARVVPRVRRLKECSAKADEGKLDGIGEVIPVHRVLDGTDLEIACNLQGEDPGFAQYLSIVTACIFGLLGVVRC